MTQLTQSTSRRQRAGARTRPHWSYSAVNQYVRCPLQYYFERVVRLPRPFSPSGLVFGSAIHEALAVYHQYLRYELAVRPETIREQFLFSWERQENERPVQLAHDETRAEVVEKGVALLDRYLEESPPSNIVGIEEEMIVPLYNSHGHLLDEPLIAVVDLLCREEEGLSVTEFKTSKRRYGDAELEMAMQATCYINAVQERYGEPVSLHYCVLVKTKTPQIQRLTTERNEQDLGRLGDTIEGVQRAIQAAAFYPVESPMNCSGCPYYRPCREWKGNHRQRRASNAG